MLINCLIDVYKNKISFKKIFFLKTTVGTIIFWLNFYFKETEGK